MKLPSKELLSEVCKTASKEKYNFLEVRRDGNNILAKFYIKEPVGKTFDYVINIYELAHKCKEWAIDLYGGEAYFMRSGNYVDWFCETGFTNGFDTKKFTAGTELEAIFKACEWIMEQTKCGS